MMPFQRARVAESRVRNKSSNGPLRAVNQGGTADHSINEDFDSSLAEKRFSVRGVFCLPSNRRSLDRRVDPKEVRKP